MRKIKEIIVRKNDIADKLFEAASTKETQEEINIAICECLIGLIGKMKGKDLSPYLSDAKYNIEDSNIVITLKFPPDECHLP